MLPFPRPRSETGRHGTADAVHTGGAELLFRGGLLAGLALLAFFLSLAFKSSINVTALFLNRQDRWLLLIGAGLLSVTSISRCEREKPFSAAIWLPLAAAALLLLFCFVGTGWVLAGYDMSIDEKLATFDATVFASGHLVQAIPPLWRDHADALNTLFMYPAAHRGAWISTYLPFNAAIRALVGTVATPALTGPLMTGIAAVALWGCARRIWPQDREAPVIALLLYVGSGQVLVTGMTAFAMPAHLAFNLVWLWLFLRRAWWADAMAIAVGFVAVGLHQPLLHPMFAGPLLLLLITEKQWPRAATYALGYAAIGAFWLWWPSWTWSLLQAVPGTRPPVGVDYFTRLTTTVLDRDSMSLPDILANLLRFVAWQHLFLLPLMLLGWKVARKDRIAGALALGVFVTILVMAVILPYQGFGFGYRYLQGLIGNCILLGVYGWRALGSEREAWRQPLLRATIAGCIVILPLQLWMSHAFYGPAAQANTRIAAIDADYAVIGKDDAPFTLDLVHNAPALDRRPVRLIGEEVNAEVATLICRNRPTVVLVGDRTFDRMNGYYGLPPRYTAAQRNLALKPRLQAAGCRVEVIP